MRFMKRLKKLGCNVTILLLKSVITKAQEYEVSSKLKFQNVYLCVAICSLVMNLSSHDFL